MWQYKGMYKPIFTVLAELYAEAKQLLTAGDLAGARVYTDKARVLRSRIKQHVKHLREMSTDEWSARLGFDDQTALEYSQLVKSTNLEWQQVRDWWVSVINSIGIDELLRSDEGVDLLLDHLIPEVWDFKHDIAVLTERDAKLYLTPLIRRGQSVIIVYGAFDHRSGEPSEDLDLENISPTQNEHIFPNQARIVYLDDGNVSLDSDQLQLINKGQSPIVLCLSHIPNSFPIDFLKKLNADIQKEFVSERSLSRWPIIFSEQLIENIPRAIGLRPVSDLGAVFRDGHAMVVSPGPSLLLSLEKIKKFRQYFKVIALVRSLPVLFDYGIIPDFAIMVDAQDHSEKHLDLIPRDPLLVKVPLLVTDFTHRSTFDANFKELFLLPGAPIMGCPLYDAIYGLESPRAEGSGVASCAVSLLAELGVRSITLVGQDLSLSGTGYASAQQTSIRDDEHEDITCLGIDGSRLPTKSDYLFFKTELEMIAKTHADNVSMINCTEVGALLEDWQHMALDRAHPAIFDGPEKDFSPGTAHLTELADAVNPVEISSVTRAIDLEVRQLEEVKAIADALVMELDRLLAEESNDVSVLEALEQNLLQAMSTEGSLISFYTMPAKLLADTSLESVESLTENFMVSSDYYGSISAGAHRLIDCFDQATGSLPR